METTTEKAPIGLTWEKIATIEPAGTKPSLCIAVSGQSRLYVTNDGIVTHNTAGDPRNPLPTSYVDANGRIKVLSTVPETDRKAAAMQAMPVSQRPPNVAAIYAEAPQDMRQAAARLASEMMARAGYALGSQSPLDRITKEKTLNTANIARWESIAKKLIRIMPGFQGGKGEMAYPVTTAIREAMPDKVRERFTTVVDYFGGGGGWGLYQALTNFDNVKNLIVYERNANRLEKIRLFHERGNEVSALLKSREYAEKLDAIAKNAGEDSTKSGSALANRLKRESPASDIEKALDQAIIDYCENSFAGKADESGNETPQAKMAQAVRIVGEQAAQAYDGAQMLRERGGKIEYRNEDSYESSPVSGDHVLSIVDPPYYRTKGYEFSQAGADLIGGTQDTVKETEVGIDTYRKTRDLLKRLTEASNGVIYTDSAWFEKEYKYVETIRSAVKGQKSKKKTVIVPPYRIASSEQKKFYDPEGQKIVSDLLAFLDRFDVVEGKIGADRTEVLGIHYGNKNDAAEAERANLGYRKGISAEGPAQQQFAERRNAESTGGGNFLQQAFQPMAKGDAGEAGAARSGDDSVAPANVLPPGTKPILIGDAMPDGLDQAFTQEQKDAFDQGFFSLDSQAADARYLDLAKDPEANREELQRMVDEAAKGAGYSIGPVFHGTNSEFHSFDYNLIGSAQGVKTERGFNFADTMERAGEFGKNVNGYFLNIKNPFPHSSRREDFRTYDPRKEGYDALGIQNGEIIGHKGEVVVFNPNQIKSADPVTYDAQGNVIPLSQRFNPQSNSILYSQSPYDHINALAQKAYAETKAGGQRTIGDPRLAYSMENEQWMGLDEYRKLNFQAQKESDWLKLAETMLANDYVGTVSGLLAKFQVKESLMPWETKAAEKVIAAEMAKPLYGDKRATARREMLYRFALGLRESRATTARTLAAMRDPHRTPEERFRAFAGDVIFAPSAGTLRKASKFISEIEKDARIATLESRIAALKPLAEKSQKQHAEIAKLEKQLAETQQIGTREQVIQQDLDERYQRVQQRLRELGVTVEDLMGGSVEVRLLGAKVISEVADAFNPEERQIIALSQNKTGGNRADIARRMGVSAATVQDVQQRYYDALKADLTKKFKLKGMGMKDLMLAGVDKAISSNPMDSNERTTFEAEEMAEEAIRKMGFIDPAVYDTTIVRSKRTNKVKPIPGKKDIVGLPAWAGPKPGEGKPLDVLLEEAKQRGIVWQDAPTGEGKPVSDMLKPAGPEWQRPTGEGKTTPGGRLDLSEGPYEWETSRFNFDDAAQRLQAMRLIQSATHGTTGWDYASEILVANLLSAPTTAITNITGYLYGLYRFTIRRAIEATMNFGGSADAATWGEFRPMMAALSRNIGTAFSNAILAWQTETPITEALRHNSQQKLGMQFDEPIGKIPGKLGRIVRMPMRFLLATDEFAKTILAHTHAATVAHRLGRSQGFEGRRLAAFINGQLGDPTSVVWDKALQEARHVTFQDKLRTFAEMDANEVGAFNKVLNTPEAILGQLTKYKNDSGPDAGLIHNATALVLRATFPFIKTPFNLLKIGLGESFLGGILEALRTKGGTGARVRQLNKQTGEWVYGEKDMGAAVNARAAILTSAIITAILAMAGEGDDDDDEKWLLVTGTTPQKDKKAQGLRELRNRTIPEQTIVMRIGGEKIMLSYRRLDPFSTWIATTVDTLSSIKQAQKGRSGWEALSRANNSLMSQVMEKASVRGFSQVANMFMGAKPPTTQDVLNTAAAWTTPNLVRNLARNSDPMLRDTDLIAGDTAAQAKYAFLPTADNAPPARRDLYGREIEQRGNFFTRAFLPGQPASVNAFAKEDITLRNWNTQNPAAPFAPETPDAKDIIKRYKTTPQMADRFMRARGEYIATQMRSKGLSGLKRPTAAQMDEIEKIAGKASEEARKRVFGK